MKTPIMLDGTLCQLCGKRIQLDEPRYWSKIKGRPQRTIWIHQKCYENLLKRK